ncbi:glycosyl hydrolase [Halalkalibacter kiskunsagensis]|uniref:Glycosyl hydrolase n=1 Tax=Halalkalibacter kiskunsagensis TaxID=1548599 RepID=A0ABV6KFT1_9BACI
MFCEKQFANPDSKYGIHPFWFWNGKMNEDEIRHQIQEMANKNVGGFFLCARQGMSVPYLSNEWFAKVTYAIEVAASYQLEVWLYDEYPYPSGMAGGEVILEHADAKHYSLIHQVEKVEGGTKGSFEMPWARVLSAKAVPISEETKKPVWEDAIDVNDFIGNLQVEPVFQKTGLTAYNQKRFFTYKPKKFLNWTAPKGTWEVHCFLEEEISDFKYYGTFVDPCHKEAMATFIESTHERYASEIKHHFGKTVKGMFSDEIGLLGKLPWSPKLLSFFKEKNGYDLRDCLQLLIDNDGGLASKVRYDYFQAIHLLLREAYHKQVHDWCEKNDMQYVAEVPAVRMTTQLYSHVPGGDSAHEKLGRSLEWILETYFSSFRANPKMISSVSNQLGRERALIECFHSVGWSMTLQDAKWMIDRLAAFGVNFFNFHAFFYTLDGLVKHDAPPSQFLQNPYWKHFKLLGDYTKRISFLMSEGTLVRSIAVLDPTTSLWEHMGNPFRGFDYSGEDEKEQRKLEKLKQHWSDICISLTTHYKDYDHLDPELLEQAEIKNNTIQIGKATYSVLILPPMTNVESAAWMKIKQFIEQGGTVIANCLLPTELIDRHDSNVDEILETFGVSHQSEDDFWNENPTPPQTELFSKGKNHAYFISVTAKKHERIQTLLTLIDDHLKEDITFLTEKGGTSFLLQQRKIDDQSNLVFISNQEGENQKTTLLIKLKNEEVVCSRLDIETGKIEQIHATKSGDGWRVELDFAPYQSQAIQVRNGKELNDKNVIPYKNEKTSQWKLSSIEGWDVCPLQDNMIRFDTFELTLGSEEEGMPTGQVQVKTFIDQCEDLAKRKNLPVSFKQIFGTPMRLNMDYPIEASYATHFTIDEMPSRCFVVMDLHAISGNYEILINGSPVNSDSFRQRFIYDHMNQVCDIHSLIKQGKNTITVKVSIEHDWDGVVDAFYIMGDFGVGFDEQNSSVITTLPQNARSLVGPYEGLPFYAGTISFKRDVNVTDLPEIEEFVVSFDEFDQFHDCAEVFINGQSLSVRAWSPYEWSGKTNILVHGENVIEVQVTTTLIGLLEGKYFDYKTHSLKDVRILEN